MLKSLRDRYKKEKDISEKERLKGIGISKRGLVENLMSDYRELLYKEFIGDNFIIMVINTIFTV